jgi:hypothetical protein
MGWSAGNTVFDPVARKARELGLSDEQVTELLTILIRELQDRDWDTEDESLEEFEDDAAIVEAFRRQGIYVRCGEEDGEGMPCELPLGHGPERDHNQFLDEEAPR